MTHYPMTPFQLTAITTQAYFHEGDQAVREILVFLGNEAFTKFENSEGKGDPKLATFRVRAVNTGNENYIGIVRLGSGELILETTYSDKFQNNILYATLNRLLPGWEIKEITTNKVVDTNPFDGKF